MHKIFMSSWFNAGKSLMLHDGACLTAALLVRVGAIKWVRLLGEAV
jgi:hypothetical protein